MACGDLFTPYTLAEGVLPILFSCGHTVCTECAEAAALALTTNVGKWACGIPACIANPSAAGGDGGAVNAGLVALVQCDAGPPAEPATLVDATSSKKRKRQPKTSETTPDFSALSAQASAAIVSAQVDLDRVHDTRESMRQGFESSKTAFFADVDSLLSAIIAHRDRVLGEAKRILDERDKALNAQVEQLSVKVSLLRQAVDVCKAAIAGSVEASVDVYKSVAKSVKGLTCAPCDRLGMCLAVGLGIDIQAALTAFEANVYIKRGVSAADCELIGPGLKEFVAGEWNVVSVVCRDHRGELIADVDVRDVSVRVLPVEVTLDDPTSLVGPLVCTTAGVFQVEYTVGNDELDVLDVDVFVYGERVARCPVRVCKTMFPSSTVLTAVNSATLRLFTVGMRSWLPAAGKPSLLFRMSRDGTKTRSFHSKCDGKGPTVVLIRSDNGYVFGGYAGEAWSSSKGLIHCEKSFLFTVSNPWSIPPTQYPVSDPEFALDVYPSLGPAFGGTGIVVGDGDGFLTTAGYTPFDNYSDTTGKGAATFTGAEKFKPAEVEVWQVY